jgi:hypothetical protein
MQQLLEWKNTARRKPMIMCGARQVGKTWLMKEFGKTHFENIAYINFENNEGMKSLFQGSYDILRLIEGLQIEANQRITPQETLLIFDEIQDVPKALTSLKYFYESSPDYAIIAGGSLLGVAMHEGFSFPVGKVDFCNLFPLCFCEFLEGVGEEALANLLRKKDWSLISTFRQKYIELLKVYYYIGGMPEAVSYYAEKREFFEVRKIHEQLLFTYERDFSKYAPNTVVPRIRSLWNSIPAQLAKENKKFSPGLVKKGSRLSEYEIALQWLLDCGLLHRVNQISKPAVPLTGYVTNAYKVYLNDVGLLAAKSGLDIKTLLEGNRIFEEFKGALTEQYVLQEMIANGMTPYYWISEGRAEVDFVFKHDFGVYPLEVKAEENLQSKSLRVYSEKFSPPFALRTSMRDYRKESWLINIPLYAIGVGLTTL